MTRKESEDNELDLEKIRSDSDLINKGIIINGGYVVVTDKADTPALKNSV